MLSRLPKWLQERLFSQQQSYREAILAEYYPFNTWDDISHFYPDFSIHNWVLWYYHNPSVWSPLCHSHKELDFSKPVVNCPPEL